MRAPTKMELKMGGAVELWERRTDGGLGCEEKTDSEEGQSIGFLFFFCYHQINQVQTSLVKQTVAMSANPCTAWNTS